MPLYGGAGDDRRDRGVGAGSSSRPCAQPAPTQPISLGDGAWGVETTGTDNGYSLRALAPLVDFVGPHVYPMEDDQVRQLLTAAFVCELAGGFGRPVVLEEFGVSSDFAADEHAAAYYRQVLHTTLLAGARGWIAWNNCDYDDLRDEDPYRHHVFELHFGLTDRDGQAEAAAPRARAASRGSSRELAPTAGSRFAATSRCSCPSTSSASSRSPSPAYRQDIRGDAPPGRTSRPARPTSRSRSSRERDGIPGHAPASTSRRREAADRRRARPAAQSSRTGGATVYLSYFAGSTANQRGPWLTGLDELFGVRHRLRYGLVDPIEDEMVTFDFVEPLGDIDAGDAAVVPRRRRGERALVPAGRPGRRSTSSPIDAHGRPALLRHALGDGSTVLCTYPLEYMAAQTPTRQPREHVAALLGARLRRRACARPVRVDDPRVLVGRVRGGSGDRRRARQLLRATRSSSSRSSRTASSSRSPRAASSSGRSRSSTLRLSRLERRRRPGRGVAGFPQRDSAPTDGAAEELIDTPDEGRDATG